MQANLASEEGCCVHGHAVWPGQQGVLAPPPPHDQGHVEPQHEGQGDGGQLVMAVCTQRLKDLS